MKHVTSVTLVLALCLAGCSQSQIVTNLQLAVDAAEAAFPIVAHQANLSPVIVAQIEGYLQGVNAGITQAAPILASTEPTARRVAQISAIFSGIVAPQLPPGTPQIVAGAVNAVAGAVAQFLASVQAPAPKALAGKPIAPSKKDAARLDKIVKKARANLSKLKK